MLKLKRPISIKKPNLKSKKTVGLSLLLVFVLAAGGWALFGDKIKDGRKVYAQAAGHKVYEQELRDFIGDNKEVSDHDAATVLADKYLTEALAKEQGITVSDQEIKEKFGGEIEKQKSDFKYAYQNKVNQLYFDKLAAYNRGVYKGKLLVTHFSRNIAPEDVVLADDKQANPELGNTAAIARDKKYAEDLINRFYNDIKSGKLSFYEAIKIERSDPAVGLKAYPSLDHSAAFNTIQTSNQGLIWTESIRQKIRSMKAGELSEPFVVKVPNSIEGDKTVESYFLVVQMDEVSGSKNDMNFGKYLDGVKKRLRYEVYV